MINKIKFYFAVVIGMILFSLPGYAQGSNGLSITLVPSATSVKKGNVVNYTFSVKNTLTVKPPIVITASAEWTDEMGNQQTSVADSVTINVIQPITVGTIKFNVPGSLSYVSNSATFLGVTTPATFDSTSNMLSVSLNKVLNEQESGNLVVGFTVK